MWHQYGPSVWQPYHKWLCIFVIGPSIQRHDRSNDLSLELMSTAVPSAEQKKKKSWHAIPYLKAEKGQVVNAIGNFNMLPFQSCRWRRAHWLCYIGFIMSLFQKAIPTSSNVSNFPHLVRMTEKCIFFGATLHSFQENWELLCILLIKCALKVRWDS